LIRFLRKAVSLARHATVLQTWGDIQRYRSLMARPAADGTELVPLRVRALGGAVVYCRPDSSDAMVFWDTFYKGYHLPTTRLRRPRVIVDLGANVGYTTAHFATRYPEARVIGVEMDGDNAALARRNVAAFGSRCRIVHAAIWPDEGVVTYSGAESWAFQVDTQPAGLVGQQVGPAGQRSARAITMERLLEEHAVERIDYLKIDIEGAECALLESNCHWLSRVANVSMECHEPGSDARCAKVLRSRGFVCTEDEHRPNTILGTCTSRRGGSTRALPAGVGA
jgi:FkbM family methyltransferase